MKLDDLTIEQFIDIVCNPDSYKSADMRELVLEYQAIVDSSAVTGYLMSMEDWYKAKMAVTLFSICLNLVKFKQYGSVREALDDCGINVEGMSDTRLEAEVKSRLERAKKTLADLEKEREGQITEMSDVRRSFDEQTAALMAHFKFQIEMATMKATIYAHLVARYNREIKARLAALNK